MAPSPPRPGPPLSDAVFVAAVVGVAAVLGVVWAGAAAAAALGGTGGLPAGLGAAGRAALRLPGHLSDPAAAWDPPARAALPGPALYWLAQWLVLGAAAGVGRLGWAVLGPRRERDGLGVERSARFARGRDLGRLVVAGPVPGRIILGRVGRRLVATEERVSLCVVGPAQSGKTSGLCVPALLELGPGEGAVIAASVKGDLHAATAARRARLGEVKVFDPTRVLVARSATWSPLRAATTATGAQAAARGLVELAGRRGMDDGDFWMDTAEGLLWPLLLVAAGTGASMAEVVRWVATHDHPVVDLEGNLVEEGEVAAALRRLESADGQLPLGPVRRLDPLDVRLAGEALGGLWAADERTRSGVYTTARTVIKAWSDPVVAAAAAGCDITPEWLLGGDNTLYVVAPARDQARLRPVFASLVADLVGSAFDVATRAGGTLETKLLVLLDEAANICPVRELPGWCSTCPSHGITLVTVWQDRSQQRLRYGPDAAETIWNNSGARVVLSGLADQATAGVGRLLGEEHHQRRSDSVDLDTGSRSRSSAAATRPLVTGDSLRRQGPGTGLLIYRHLPPARLRLRPAHAERRLRRLAQGRPRPSERLRRWAGDVGWRLLARLGEVAAGAPVPPAGPDAGRRLPPGPAALPPAAGEHGRGR